jgi:hypothetical protein
MIVSLHGNERAAGSRAGSASLLSKRETSFHVNVLVPARAAQHDKAPYNASPHI